MVEEQLVSRGIVDPQILRAFNRVSRDRFVPKKYKDSAYGDFPLPIGQGQTISQPLMVAIMTQGLQLYGKEKVLEIGTGSGYQAAILAELAAKVFTVERVPNLAKKAEKILRELGYSNIKFKIADGTMGWKEFAPYDAIVVTAGTPIVPKPLIKQLKVGGRLVIPLGGNVNQILTVVKKYRNRIETSETCGCIFVPLVGKYGWRATNAR